MSVYQKILPFSALMHFVTGLKFMAFEHKTAAGFCGCTVFYVCESESVSLSISLFFCMSRVFSGPDKILRMASLDPPGQGFHTGTALRRHQPVSM